jgi:SAM-dependent methyltransferase
MEMNRFEKFFVNTKGKGLSNLRRIRRAMDVIDAERVHDVLEIGCGIGTVSATLARERGWSVVGTDYDPEQVGLAKRRHPEHEGLRFQREDATRLTFPDASFDLEVAQMVFHHIPDWPAAVTELARVLRPGGLLVWYDHVIPARVAAHFKGLVQHFGLCTPEALTRAFGDAGFERVRSRSAGPFFVKFEDTVYRKLR